MGAEIQARPRVWVGGTGHRGGVGAEIQVRPRVWVGGGHGTLHGAGAKQKVYEYVGRNDNPEVDYEGRVGGVCDTPHQVHTQRPGGGQ